jgi:glucose/arabinose dehydrogenase
MAGRHRLHVRHRYPVILAAAVAVCAACTATAKVLTHAASRPTLADPSPTSTANPTGTLPPALQAEIAANNAAGLPGLGNGVMVPAGCDIATSLEPNGRVRIEQERTVHRQLNQGQSPVWIATANAQLQAYLQVAVRDYCASGQ